MKTAVSLRPYQTNASAAICEAFFRKGQNRLLVKKPTGMGKTVWFASLLAVPELKAWLETFPAHDRKMLVIAHREELLTQAQARILDQHPGLMVAIEQADSRASRFSDVVVASIQTLAAMKFRRLKRFLQHHQFRIVIVDEAHHAAAASYRTALVHLGFLPPSDATDVENIEAPDYDDVAVMERALGAWDTVAPKDRLLIGVTATPNRSDAIGLSCVFQSLAYSYELRQAIKDGWLVPPVPWVIESDVSLDDVRITAGEFNQKDLAAAVNQQRRNQLAVAGWQERAQGLSTIAFTVDVAHAHALAEEFRQAGIRAVAISGETPKEQRRSILWQYSQGQIEVLVNCMVLTEGTDLPRTSCIVHAKPTKSATLYEQMTGRGLRLFPGKTACIVLDVADVSRKHSLQTAPVLYGLPPGCVVEGNIDDFAAALERMQEKYQHVDFASLLSNHRYTLEQLQAKATTFDVWAVQALGAFGAGRALDWMRIGESYRLSYPWLDGIETIQVGRDLLNKWEVVCTLRATAPGAPPNVRQRTIARELTTADEAAGLAERFVLQERRSVTRIAAVDAPWKTRPASEKQLALLRRRAIPHNAATITMGAASKLIDIYNARRRG